MKTLRRAASIAALVAVSLGVALALAEVLARLGWPPAPELRVPVVEPLPADLASLPEIRGVYALRHPNVRGLYKGVLHRTNGLGVRGPDYAPWPAPGVFRIVVIGDSVTMGQGVDEGEAYPARLESLLRESQGRDFEVINLGVSGLNIRHSVNRLRRVGLRYHPDLVVYGYTLNDIEGPAWKPNPREERMAHLELETRYHDSRSVLLQRIWPRLLHLANALRPLPGTYAYALDRAYFHDPEAWQQVTDGLDDLARLASEHGICAHLFVHAQLDTLGGLHPYTRFYRRVEQAARERGMTVTQSLAGLRQRDAADLRFSIVDPHPNAEGHRLLAEILHRGLLDLPARCLTKADAGRGG